MTALPYTVDKDDPAAPPLGLIVLAVDETIEAEFRRAFADRRGPFYVSRIPSGHTVTRDSLAAMAADLRTAAGLLPKTRRYPVVGYGCTSASAVIGSEKIETLVQRSCTAAHVTNPLRAALAQAEALGANRFALLSPYVEEVNQPLRAAFAARGVSTEVFASFEEPEEARVARISIASIAEAAIRLGEDPQVEAVFISCTNLRTLDVIGKVAAKIGKPVLSSNSALAWHMQRLEAIELRHSTAGC